MSDIVFVGYINFLRYISLSHNRTKEKYSAELLYHTQQILSRNFYKESYHFPPHTLLFFLILTIFDKLFAFTLYLKYTELSNIMQNRFHQTLLTMTSYSYLISRQRRVFYFVPILFFIYLLQSFINLFL